MEEAGGSNPPQPIRGAYGLCEFSGFKAIRIWSVFFRAVYGPAQISQLALASNGPRFHLGLAVWKFADWNKGTGGPLS